MNVRGLRIGVWGAGVEGRAAVDALAAANEITLIADHPDADDVRRLAADFGLPVSAAAEISGIRALDVVVRSPGVSIHRPEVAALRTAGVRVTTLLSLWLEHCRPPIVVGVTGTKGKSSTSLMIQALLGDSVGRVEVVGNIGRPIVEATGCDVAIVEISSYQAADLTTSPDVGVLTNVGVDHLPWHGSAAQYRADKLHMFAHPQLRFAALGVPDPALERQLAARTVTTAVVGPTTYDNDSGSLRRAGSALAPLAGSPFAVRHFGDNLALACIVVEEVSGAAVTPDAVERLTATFELPPGRMEVVTERDGVRWINDCLASNPMGAAAAIDAHHGVPLVLILGGASRGVDVAPIAAAARRHDGVRQAIVIGEVAPAWADVLRQVVADVVEIQADDVAAAVGQASSVASQGDTVLFSPGAPTSPHVGTWIDRREIFIAAVRDR